MQETTNSNFILVDSRIVGNSLQCQCLFYNQFGLSKEPILTNDQMTHDGIVRGSRYWLSRAVGIRFNPTPNPKLDNCVIKLAISRWKQTYFPTIYIDWGCGNLKIYPIDKEKPIYGQIKYNPLTMVWKEHKKRHIVFDYVPARLIEAIQASTRASSPDAFVLDYPDNPIFDLVKDYVGSECLIEEEDLEEFENLADIPMDERLSVTETANNSVTLEFKHGRDSTSNYQIGVK